MRFIKQSFFAVIIAISLVGCGSYHKLMKSTDYEKKYTAALNYFYKKDNSKAIALFQDVASVYAGSEREDTIMFYMGKALYNSNMLADASEVMNSFRYKFPRSAFTEESEFIYAMCFYNQSGNYERDQSTSFSAIQAFNEYLNRYPESIKKDDVYVMIEELTRKIYLKRYSNAAIYYKLGKYNAAITSLRSTLKEYPEIPFKEDIMYLTCKSWYDYAANSVPSRQLDRYMKMMDAYYSYKSEYPQDTKRLKELDGLFDKSKTFVDEHGYYSKAITTDNIDIEQRIKTIDEKKEKRFMTRSKEEKAKLTQEIKYEKEQLKKDRKTIRDNKKELKFQGKQLKNLEKQEKNSKAKNDKPQETIDKK